MFQLSLTLLAILLAIARGVSGWGALGHETVAYIAQDFVSSTTKTYVQNILGDTSTSYMANAATWADSYRSTSAGSWSADLHFVDANDSPPSSCNVNYSRDCSGNKCVIGAISNYVCASPSLPRSTPLQKTFLDLSTRIFQYLNCESP